MFKILKENLIRKPKNKHIKTQKRELTRVFRGMPHKIKQPSPTGSR